MRLALSLVLLCSLTASARADGFYYTESFGAATVKDQLAKYMPTTAVRFRMSLGMRRDHWALEAFVGGTINGHDGDGVENDGSGTGTAIGYGPPPSIVTYGLDLKYLQPISEHFDAYLRGSLGKGMLTGRLDDYSGRSAGLGAGLQVKGKVRALGFLWWPLFFTGIGPKVTAALFLDDGMDYYRFHKGGKLDQGPTIDANITHLTLGFAVGSDF